jgi:rubrerythrin
VEVWGEEDWSNDMTKRLTTPDEILQAALKMEMQARDFYVELEKNCSVDFVKELLQTLQNEESKHVHLIQKMLGRVEAG